MGRTVVRRVDQPRSRTARDWLLLVGGAVILAFALVGVVSAGLYVGNKVAGGTKTHHHTSTTTTSAAIEDVARAQAQATAIVKAAQDAGQSIVNGAQKRANKRAQRILANARKQSAATVAAGAAATGSSGTSSSGPATAPATSSTGSSTSTTAPSTGSTTSPTNGGTSVTTGAAPSGTPAVPNLSGVPATWLVVGYNATFGSGPGTAGSISVINRDSETFSGVARVDYIGTGGVIGSASAPFSNLAPGQSEVLPLDGAAYPSGATSYRIEIVNVH